ncbi:hypothetical protein [Streptomyces acidiscabies]|uniref:hypothetical protein n=1 Tax=Streptomyces acidiscabies TaxID=42234 RepID=UPI0009514DBC|nr:hypothetical protein [Streptomyces acidiscabies]
MPAISVGSVEVDVIPSTRGIYNRLRDGLVPAATRAGEDAGNAAGRAFGPAMRSSVGDAVGARIGQQIGQQIAARITASIRDSLRDGVTQGGRTARPAATRQGDETAGAFARAMRARLEAAFRSMPRLDVRLSDTGVDAELARLRARLESLAGRTIGVDVSAEQAQAAVAEIEARLRQLSAAHPNVTVRADTAAAIAQLQALRAAIDEATADPARIRVETDGTFGQRLRAQVRAAEASLPNINLRADSTAAEVEIARMRAQLTALREVRIGVDMDAATALARIAEIQARLQRLSASDADVAVRADTASAVAQLAVVQGIANRLDGQTARVDVQVSGMQALVTAALAFGPALLPVLPVVAAGLGAVAAAAVAAGAGLGAVGLVAVPAFKQIGSVLQAQKAAQEAATNATYRGGQASSQAASKALQMAGAQQQLAAAERNGARQIAQAQSQVVQAKRAVGDAVAQAALRNEQANRRVLDAERSLADAQRDARRAQEDLTAARRTAAQELEDLNNRLTDSVLSQRDAEIALREAAVQRDKVLSNPNASELDRQKAILAYDQAVQRLKEQRTETARLKTETAAANKAGVEGSATVTNAQQKLADSQRRVADQAQSVRDAQAEAARTQVETARQVADAQQRVSEATSNVAQAQASAADAVASAQRQIASASVSAAGGIDQAAIAQAKYQAELAKLSPEARATLNAYTGLRDAFSDWSTSLQPEVMPIFTRALNGLRNALPGLTPFATEAAKAVGELQDRASRGFKSPWWKTFKKDLQGSVRPAIIGLGVAFGNVFKGMGGIIGAFLPHMDSISERMQRITGRFADWGTGLKGSPAFEKFLAYSAEMGPIVSRAIGDIIGAIFSLGKAMAPISGPILALLGGIGTAIGIIADHAPWLIQGIYGIILATHLWTIAQAALNFVMSANPLVLIGLAIVALVGLVVYAYNRFGWFRTSVQVIWQGIATVSLWLWNTVLKPVFTWIGDIVVWLWNVIIKPYVGFMIAYWQAVGTVVLWLWQKAISPVLGWIGAGIKLWWAGVKLYLGSVATGVTSLGNVFVWLWQKGVSPVLGWIAKAIGGFWKNDVKPIFDVFKAAVGQIGKSFATTRDTIRTAWGQLKAIAREPVQFIVDTVYNRGLAGVWNKIAGAFGAPKLPVFKFADGGVMPGYTPGRDVHKFVSPTGGGLELSGGESFFRPEFTRGVGSRFVAAMNGIAKSQGAQGVRAVLAPVLGGNPDTPVDRSLRYADGGVVQRFADGGIFGWIKSAGSAVLGAGSAAWNAVKKGASWLTDTIEASARAGVKNIVDPLLKSFPGMDTGFGQMLRRIPTKMIDALFGYGKEADKQGGGGLGGPKVQAALRWAKTQNGLPYQWGGNGNPSWDCSGFMSAIESVLRGEKPHRRWSTHAFSGKTAPPGWVYHGDSPFRVGITAAGVGHTAGTLGGTKVESRGGDGVVVGNRARGYNDKLFTSWYGFKPGSYDSGGYLQPGLNLAYNGTGRPEPVFTTSQANALTSLAARGESGPAEFTGPLYLDSGEFLGVVHGVMEQRDRQLVSTLRAGRKG